MSRSSQKRADRVEIHESKCYGRSHTLIFTDIAYLHTQPGSIAEVLFDLIRFVIYRDSKPRIAVLFELIDDCLQIGRPPTLSIAWGIVG
jgi:hypothetical protein